MRDNGHGLIIQVSFVVNVCVCGGFRFNGFVTKMQPFIIDGHYMTNIISAVGHSRLDFIVPLVLCTVAVQYPKHQYCTTSPSG
jgi:hypothetical protein